jgi:Xaa-Pro aminopeptidase
MNNFEIYQKVQTIAKETIEHLKDFIRAGVTEQEIVNEAEKYLKENGIQSFWYYDVGAFVFVGERTKISISGKKYNPTDEMVKEEDIVTVDLSPELNECWGDFARSFIVSNGKVATDWNKINGWQHLDQELYEGLVAEETLHKEYINIVTPTMSFEEVYEIFNEKIKKLGFNNLDFLNNLGHTIEKHKENRLYFEAGNKKKLGDVTLFTFEPHIMKANERYGFKREEIYYFNDGVLVNL